MLVDWALTSLVLVVAATFDGARGDTMIGGTVFCDQCKDGDIGTLDYPLGGVRVLLACPGEHGQFTVMREETTSWLGTFTVSFPGLIDMGNCRAQISGNGQGCGAAGGPAQNLVLMYKLFDNQMYRVEPLIAQPATPSPFCRRPSPLPDSRPPPNVPPLVSLPPVQLPPLPPLPQFPPVTPMAPLPPFFQMPPLPSYPPSSPTTPSPPLIQLPPLPPLPPLLPPITQLPPLAPLLPPITQSPPVPQAPPIPQVPPVSPLPPASPLPRMTDQLPAVSPSSELPPSPPELPSMPPLPESHALPPLPPMPIEPFFNSSACSHQMWVMPEHKCYWNVLVPNLTVALVFGPIASTKFGTNITLLETLYGRSEPYRTLLREGTTALLNSYASNQFVYQPQDIVQRLNSALEGNSTLQVLTTAYRFIKANSGQMGNTTCKFSTCA